jgi:hypothetical protein
MMNLIRKNYFKFSHETNSDIVFPMLVQYCMTPPLTPPRKRGGEIMYFNQLEIVVQIHSKQATNIN